MRANNNSHRTFIRGLSVFLAIVCLVAMPLTAQGNGKSAAGRGEVPDPGFPHNQTGRNSAIEGSLPDYGNYCGPLPSVICHGTLNFRYVLSQDPFAPNSWVNQLGNASVLAQSLRKGWPLQTVTVVDPEGKPVANARVKFFESGYSSRGIRGLTDDKGEFLVAVRRPKRSHRFLVDVFGYSQARLDIVGRGIATASHKIVLTDPSRAERSGRGFETTHRIAVMGGTELPGRLAKDYRRAQKALNRENFGIAIPELKALVERWPVGTLQDGSTYDPQALLVEALEGAGEEELAQTVGLLSFKVEKVETVG